MGFTMSEDISKLIESLKVNDHIKVQFLSDVKFDKIISMGEKAVDPLICLVKQDPDLTRWSTIYALQILCRIGGSKATRILLDFFKKYDESDIYRDIFVEVSEYMARENHSSNLCVDTILEYVEKFGEDNFIWDFLGYATEGGLRDERLFSLFLSGLKSKNEDVVLTAVLCLGEYADNRAVPRLAELLKKFSHSHKGDFPWVVPNILDSIQNCTTLFTYREILSENPWIVKFYTDQMTEKISEIGARIQNIYSRKPLKNEELDRLAFELGAIFVTSIYLGLYNKEIEEKILSLISTLIEPKE